VFWRASSHRGPIAQPSYAIALLSLALRFALFPAIAVLAGCGAARPGDEPPLTRFEAHSKNEFTFEARAGIEYPEDSEEAEATRMQWLGQALADRGMCPGGYEITGRTLVAAKEEALGQTHNVAYHGKCK
jgi:hypothetical protein